MWAASKSRQQSGDSQQGNGTSVLHLQELETPERQHLNELESGFSLPKPSDKSPAGPYRHFLAL